MRILIIGNIGSGKTTLGKKIREIIGYKFVQIDEIREQYLKNAVSEEYFCLYYFLKTIEQNKNIIVEFIGTGFHKYAVKRALEFSNIPVLVVLCKTKLKSTLMGRIKLKAFNHLNLLNLDIHEYIRIVENELNQDICSKFWPSKNFKFLEVFMENLHDLRMNVLLIQKVVNSNSNITK